MKLFNYPCVYNDAPFREYRGHASHVMCVRFLADDRRVVTAGGHDRAVLVFRTQGVIAEEENAPVERPKQPQKDVLWAALDKTGKMYGWVPAK